MHFHFDSGRIPLLVSMPHVGTDIPDDIASGMSTAALHRADTDWHLQRLYEFSGDLRASTLAARWSRYVIDLNRPPENTNLYPGQDTTGLCPLDTFAKEALYLPGREPDAAQVNQRLQQYWQPYHQQLQAEIARMLNVHGIALVWDAHSIASVVPRFFAGKLPDLNFGTADGQSCNALLAERVQDTVRQQNPYSHIFNGRFKGGYITRHYGNPAQRVHALQLEMCQCTYMDEAAPFAYRSDLAQQVQPLLRALLKAAATWATGT